MLVNNYNYEYFPQMISIQDKVRTKTSKYT